MHIEVWQGISPVNATTGRPTGQRWHWHFRSKGRIVADAEPFPTKANAVRAAKAVVRAVIAQYCVPDGFDFTAAPDPKRPGVTIIRW